MAVELHIKHGDNAVESKDLLSAITHYSEALRENPDAFLAYTKRASVYTKLCDYENAKADISKAFAVAEKRGKRSDKALCHYRLGLTNYGEKDFQGAVVNFKRAKELGSTEAALDIWLLKAERDVKRSAPLEPVADSSKISESAPSEPVSEISQTPKSTSIDAINKAAPLKVKIREDWYQNNETVTVTIYAKNIKPETLLVDFSPRSVAVSFPSADNSEYNYNLEPLFGEISTEESRFKVYSTKMEITLVKKEAGKWSTLEGNAKVAAESGLVYPSSAKKAVNWSNFSVKEEEETEDFFAKLYKDVDDDTRRAMMKSYVESNGTVLTTNWEEASQKKFETSPPEGMEAKKWGQ